MAYKKSPRKNGEFELPDENMDIILRVKKIYRTSLIKSIVWYAFWILFYALVLMETVTRVWQDRLFVIGVALIIYLAFPFLKFKLHKVFLDKPWSGVIEHKKFKRVIAPPTTWNTAYTPTFVAAANKSFAGTMQNYHKEIAILTIRRDDGKLIRIKLEDDGYEPGSNYYIADNFYKLHDEVIHYRGVKYPKKKYRFAEDEEKFKNLCLYCGAINMDKYKLDKCDVCKHTLIK